MKTIFTAPNDRVCSMRNPLGSFSLINPFDAGVLHFFNQFAQRSPAFDKFVNLVTNDFLLRGGVVTSMLWWAWFRQGSNKIRDREIILSGSFSALVAVSACRGLVNSLPFRPRPIDVPSLHFVIPIGFEAFGVIHWSSFPSDHAVLYFALATTIFLVSRRAGIFAYCFAFLVVCMPRIYLGLHYPSDVLAGELIGVGAACLFARKTIREAVAGPLLHWLEVAPGSFYGCFYLGSFVLATNVDSLRIMSSFALQILANHLHHAH
jgi:membrane-associated phospholipid phosphatase